MAKEQSNPQSSDMRPILHKIKDRIFDFYEYRINFVSNQLERKHIERKNWELVNMCDIELELYEFGLRGFKDPLKALFGSSYITKYDPFGEFYKDNEPWDHTQGDFIKLLASYVVTDDPEWFELMFKKFLVRCVSQHLGGKTFNKQCFTLVGKQNDGKTRFLDYLVPESLKGYYKKGFDFGSKDGKISLVQNGFINLDELASFEKKELNNEFKAVLSESTVKYRPLFQNTEVPFLRRANFVASTNQFEFLTDETGNVRWLPFIVKSINHDNGGPNGYESIDINRVWAQAYYLFNDPEFKAEMLPSEIIHQEALNRRFFRSTNEMEVVEKHFSVGSKGELSVEFFTISEIGQYLKSRYPGTLHRHYISRALKMMGHQQSSNYDPSKGHSIKGYFLKIN